MSVALPRPQGCAHSSAANATVISVLEQVVVDSKRSGERLRAPACRVSDFGALYGAGAT